MKYIVTMSIVGKYTKEIEANNTDYLREIMDTYFVDADFGELENIEGHEVIAEDENGEIFELLY